MRVGHKILFVLLFYTSMVFTQVKVVAPVKPKREKKPSNFGIGVGITRSVVYLPRNVQNNNDAAGRSIMCSYDAGNFIRYTLEYNRYKTIDFSPTWQNVKASCIESNIHFIASFKDGHSYFYPMLGFSYNFFSGYFTGKNDYYNLRTIYQPNSKIVSNWIGFNAGTGYEYNFKNSAIYLSYKMRVGYTEGNEQYNIQDICITIGYKVFVSGPSLKKIFRGTRSRYVLSKPKKKK